ncbi:MAG: trypsin-like peptidase domain-containing protein [Spirochaetales bacterium]|nr:trypsin-like peptidase domain-containing protein [Spirochaetales bacterium]
MSWIQRTIHQSVSLIKAVFPEEHMNGTGFFYSHIADADMHKQKSWLKVENQYFITAKHCLFNYNQSNFKYELCDSLIISFTLIEDGKANKQDIEFDKDILKENILLHENEDIDIALIDISNIIKTLFPRETQIKLMGIRSLSRRKLPQFNNILKVETTSEVIVFGFPYGHYDEVNLFPLCKSGIIASGWNYDFNDDPCFKIDVQLFPVSSGSPVISKPIDIVVKDNNIMTNNIKDILLLGIYTGEYQRKIEEKVILKEYDRKITLNRETSLGFGTVYYSYLIEDIILRHRIAPSYNNK